jgi:carbonic anhydrase/acetyltransferase-like protein (isoleucine patch superfamily)
MGGGSVVSATSVVGGVVVGGGSVVSATSVVGGVVVGGGSVVSATSVVGGASVTGVAASSSPPHADIPATQTATATNALTLRYATDLLQV